MRRLETRWVWEKAGGTQTHRWHGTSCAAVGGDKGDTDEAVQATHVVFGRIAPLLHVHDFHVQHSPELHLDPAEALHGEAAGGERREPGGLAGSCGGSGRADPPRITAAKSQHSSLCHGAVQSVGSTRGEPATPPPPPPPPQQPPPPPARHLLLVLPVDERRSNQKLVDSPLRAARCSPSVEMGADGYLQRLAPPHTHSHTHRQAGRRWSRWLPLKNGKWGALLCVRRGVRRQAPQITPGGDGTDAALAPAHAAQRPPAPAARSGFREPSGMGFTRVLSYLE